MLCWKPLGHSGLFRAWDICLLAQPCDKPFSSPNFWRFSLFGFTVHWTQELALTILPIIGPCISPLGHGCAWQVNAIRKKQVDYPKSKRLSSLSSTWNSAMSLWPLGIEDQPFNTFPQKTFHWTSHILRTHSMEEIIIKAEARQTKRMRHLPSEASQSSGRYRHIKRYLS